MQMMEENLKKRSELRSLPKDVDIFLSKYRDNSVSEAAPSKVRPICYICGPHKNNKTGVVCNNCKKQVCKHHSVRQVKCNACDKNYNEIEEEVNNSFDKNVSGHATVANDHSSSNINTMPNNTNFTYTSSEQSNSHGRDSNLIKFSDNFSGVPANDVKESSNHDIIISDETFPNIGESHVRLKTKNYNLNSSRKKNNLIPSKQPSFPVPANKDFSFPNGTFLKYMSENTYAFPKENSWISSLWNCRSLRARHNDFSFVLAENKCQCALLSETWLLPNSRISIPKYHVFRQDRHDGYGRVAIVTHQSINSKRFSLNDNIRHMLELHSIDIIGIEITINDKTLDLWSIYTPPSSNPFSETFNNIFSLMNQSSLIGGDFNGHHPVWGSSISDFRGNLIHSDILDYGLCVLNNGEATRINRPSYPDTMVDISISSPNISLSCSWSVLPDPFGSDHLPILISIPNRPSYSNFSHNNYNTSTRFSFYATDWNQFTYQVASLLEPFTLDSSPLNNYNNFVNVLLCATKKSTPLKCIIKKKYPISAP
ncbi:hypothetical protein QTP88_023450 [Uroleucon formosanum]